MVTLENTIEEIFQYYREHGFPNYNREDYSVRNEYTKVASADTDEYFNGEIFYKHNSANGFLFSYFPHWIEVQCGKSISIKEAWKDDALLKQLIEKTHKYCTTHGENWTTNRIRQNAKVYLAKQSVSNFNPIVARILYDTYAPNGTVYDMSMGWGGRIMGFYASSAKEYIGCDPSTKTYKGLQQLDADLKQVRNKSTKLLNIGSEHAELPKESIDFAFTSPPYFDTEKYANEPTQSFIAYPTIELWLQQFIKPTLEKTYNALKHDSTLAINYADNPIASEILKIATEIGFKHTKTLKLELSSIAGNKAKYEPIFILTKGNPVITTQGTLF